MNESQIVELWTIFKEYLDKKQIETAAERFIDLCADHGTDDETFQSALGNDSNLDYAIKYYLDDDDEDDYDDDDEDWY